MKYENHAVYIYRNKINLRTVLETITHCIQWNLSITDTIGESQFVRYREVSLVERFDILMTIIAITVIYIHVVIIILKYSCNVASLADARLSYSKDTTVSILRA